MFTEREPVEDMRSERIAGWKVGMLELAGVRHLQPFHHRDRATVGRNGEGDDLFQAGLRETECERGTCEWPSTR